MNALFGWLATGVVHGTLVLAAAWLVSRTVLRSAHPSARALLWLLVLLKFALPFGPTLEREQVAAPSAQPAHPVAVASSRVPSMVAATWCVVVAALGLVRARRSLRARRRLTDGADASAQLEARVRAWAGRLRAPMPRVIEGRGPCVVGVARPVLVLPAGVDGARLDAMIVHELTHLRRRDHVVQVVQAIVETLFFFWPPVRWAGRQLALEREQACDVAVLDSGSIGSVEYAHLLVDVSTSTAGLAMGAMRSQLEWRIDMLLNVKSARPRWWLVAAFSLVAVGASSKVMEKAAPTPVVIAGADARVTGSVSREAVQMVLYAHGDELRDCYEDFLAENPGAQGGFSIHGAIGDDGLVKEVCVGEGFAGSEALGRCISDRLTTWQFPAPWYGEQVQMNLPFTFALR